MIQQNNPVSLLSTKFTKVMIITCSLPLLSFILCIISSLYLHFEASTSTHCKVRNYLPSISASVGGYSPEKYIWRIGIALHCVPRYVFAFMNKSRNRRLLQKWHLKEPFVNTIFVLNVLEISCLVGLTFISSTENYFIHEKLFMLFVFTESFYMLLSIIAARNGSKLSRVERKALRLKKICFTSNVVALLSSAYFFYRHQTYCEPGVYTLFALCEYIVVVTNVGFHFTGYFDFYDYNFIIVNIV